MGLAHRTRPGLGGRPRAGFPWELSGPKTDKASKPGPNPAGSETRRV